MSRLAPFPAAVYWCRAPLAGWQSEDTPREWQVWQSRGNWGASKLAQHPSLKEAKRLARERLANPGRWRNHTFSCVNGCVDAHGAIIAKPFKQIEAHTREMLRGKRWRWMIRSQEFGCLGPRTTAQVNDRSLMQLTEEERFLVADWLVRHEYADEELLRQ